MHMSAQRHEESSGQRTSPPGDAVEAELDRLYRRLTRMADGEATEAELWAVVQRIRDLRAQL
jgi:hypothetical protein